MSKVRISGSGSQFGEKNYLLDSGKPRTCLGYQFQNYYFSEKPVVGETYTIVLKGKLGADRVRFSIYNSGGSVFPGQVTPSHDGSICSVTFKWTETSPGGAVDPTNFLAIYNSPSSGKDPSTIDWIKLVRGSVTTKDWTPASWDEVLESLAAIEESLGITSDEPEIEGPGMEDWPIEGPEAIEDFTQDKEESTYDSSRESDPDSSGGAGLPGEAEQQ